MDKKEGLRNLSQREDLSCQVLTYDYWWIKQYIIRYLPNKSKSARLLVSPSTTMKTVKKWRQQQQ